MGGVFGLFFLWIFSVNKKYLFLWVDPFPARVTSEASSLEICLQLSGMKVFFWTKVTWWKAGDDPAVTKLAPLNIEVTNNLLKGYFNPSQKGHKELPGTCFFCWWSQSFVKSEQLLYLFTNWIFFSRILLRNISFFWKIYLDHVKKEC